MRARWLPLSVAVPALLACSMNTCGRAAHKVVPAVREIDPAFATEAVPCEEKVPMPSQKGCAMQDLSCGDEVLGSTTFGPSLFDDDFYQTMMCAPAREQYRDSPEAIYRLTIPADIRAKVTLVSDCADLDLATYRWEETGRCPTSKHPRAQCEMNTGRGGGTVIVQTVGSPEHHLVIVDGKHGERGNFRLRVDCETYR
jgi:hypothetical protein